MDDNDCEVPVGEVGELLLRTDAPWAMNSGYYKEPEATARAWRNGWFHTGDMGSLDERGRICFHGRLKDMLKVGGENVSPREIEEFLYTHPDIADVQVVGVPDARYGEEVCAFVQMRSGAPFDAEAIREFCRGTIAHFKVPRYLLDTDEFPMTVTGKVRKVEMRETSISELGLQAAAATKTA